MKRKCILVWAITALLFGGILYGETARELIQQYRDEALYNLSAVPDAVKSDAAVWCVDSGSANTSDTADGRHGETWYTPFATIDYAIGRCTANSGDIILVAPGHSETKSATGALITADVAGVTIIGLGTGDDKPNLTLSHTGATIDITADNVTFEGFYVDITGVDSINAPFNVSGLYCTLRNNTFYAADDDGQTDVIVTVGIADGDANDLLIENCRFIAPVAGAASAITIVKDMKNVVIRNCIIYGDFSDSGIEIPAGGNASKNVLIDGCTITNLNSGDHAIQVNSTTCTGSISNCTLRADAAATVVDAGGLSIADSTSLVVIGTGEGAPLPANTTAVDLFGAFTGPAAGTQQDDNVKASLDLAHTDLDSLLTVANDLAGISQIGDKVQADMDANSADLNAIKLVTDDLAGISQLGDKVVADMDANSILADLQGRSQLGDKVVADMDANSTILTDLAGISQIGDKIVVDMDANSTRLAILTDLGGISQVGDKVVADMDANSILADLQGRSQLGDKIQADMDANSTQLYWMEKTIKVLADEVTQDLLAVTGGPILITHMWGLVDVLIGANVTTCKIVVDVTAGAAWDYELSTAVAITADVAGTMYVFTDANPSVLTPLTPVASGGSTLMAPWICQEGMLEQTMSADPGGAVGDHISWYISYKPLVSGITVTGQ